MINGVEVTVVDDEDAAQIAEENDGAVWHVCIRVADSTDAKIWPELKARRRKILCESCGELIWFDPLSVPKGLIAISRCIQCMTGPFGLG